MQHVIISAMAGAYFLSNLLAQPTENTFPYKTIGIDIYLLYKAEKPSVRLSTLFWWSVSQPWLHGSTSDLLDMIAMSSDMTKFIFKSL